MQNSSRQITKSELQKYIISEAMKMLNAGDAMDVDMNQNDKEVGSDGNPGTALVKVKEKGGFEKKSSAPAAADNIEETEEAMDVDLNQNDKELGSDGKVAAAVSVEAGSGTKKGDSIEGMKNANFESKDKNPSTASSTPFEERKEKVDMNAMDKTTDDGAKTYVEAGSDMSKGDSTGQAKANWSEAAKNEKEKAEAIAKAIQLPETFKNKKELLGFINEHAKKLSSVLIKEELRQGVYNDFNEWKASFAQGTQFPQKNGYVFAMDAANKELGKWNGAMTKGLHSDDFQYQTL